MKASLQFGLLNTSLACGLWQNSHSDSMAVQSRFATHLYESELADEALLSELAHSIRSLALDDNAGRQWSKQHRYSGYTSYASLNDLPKRDPAFADLAKLLTHRAIK